MHNNHVADHSLLKHSLELTVVDIDKHPNPSFQISVDDYHKIQQSSHY